MKAVILAGGLGTRLQPYTMFVPKPMLPLGEKPLLEHTIRWAKKNGVKSFVLCTSYLHRVIEERFISTGMFVRASISISNSTTIEDISNNTVQGGVTQSVIKN